jgi:acetyl-CoA acyltransferase
MNGRRVAVLAGCRTPFVKAGGVFRDLSAVDLGKAAVRELLERTEVDPGWIGSVAMGQVVPSVRAPNLAREVALGAGLPKEVPAHTVNRACASASQAIADVASAILLGHIDAGIAGGAESLSDVPILHSRNMARALVAASKAKSLGARLRAFAGIRLRDLRPDAPAIAEPSTGLTMGQSAEKMARENGITREEQDHIAFLSHRNGADATDDGRLPAEICPVFVPPKYDEVVGADNLLRRDTTPEALAALPPVFDRRFGTVTAGNSSPLTDGAAAVLVMDKEKAKALGLRPRARFHSFALGGVDPVIMLTGPIPATTNVLKRSGLTLRDIDAVEINEAFAPVVLAWEQEHHPDMEKVNVNGGAITIGHPLGCSGARLMTTLLNELERTGGRYGLQTMCEGGGQANVTIIERLG